MNWIIPGVLAYLIHEMGHVLACLILSVPLKGVQIRPAGICIVRSRVHDWRDYAVSSAGMMANLLSFGYALIHADPWFSFASLFMFLFAGLGDLWIMWQIYHLDRGVIGQ